MGSESDVKKRILAANLLEKLLDSQHPYATLQSGDCPFTSLQETGGVV